MRIRLLIGVCLAGLVEGCGGSDSPPHAQTPVYTDAQSAITIGAGREFALALAANPTTGYEWQMTGTPAAGVASLVGSQYSVDPNGAVGGGGTSTWTFRTVAAGQTTISLTYARPFVANDPTARTVTWTVTVE